jgi:hypothetical protein
MLVESSDDNDISSYPPGEEMYKGLTILHLACAFDQESVMKYFLRFGLSSTMKVLTDNQQTLSHVCAWFGTPSTMSLLVKTGAKVNDMNARGHAPLHLAGRLGALPMQPLVLRPLSMRPLVIMTVALRPHALRPLAMRPLAMRPLNMRPLAMRPLALRPLALRPLDMRPLVMRPLAVRPLAMRPLAMRPKSMI